MPIYEFYCPDCNLLLNFFSSTSELGARRPACPHCERKDLEKRPARFAIGSGSGGSDESDELEGLPAGLDETKLEQAFMSMAGELESLGESEDPRALATMMRKLTTAAGIEAGPRMEEMISRLEAGEDPDALDESLGADESEDDFSDWFQLRKKLSAESRLRRARTDSELYFL